MSVVENRLLGLNLAYGSIALMRTSMPPYLTNCSARHCRTMEKPPRQPMRLLHRHTIPNDQAVNIHRTKSGTQPQLSGDSNNDRAWLQKQFKHDRTQQRHTGPTNNKEQRRGENLPVFVLLVGIFLAVFNS